MYLINSKNCIHTFQNSVKKAANGSLYFSISRESRISPALKLLYIFAAAMLLTLFWRQPATAAIDTCKTFTGRVHDRNTLEPLEGALISLDLNKDPKFETKTDSNGRFAIYNIPCGTYKAVVSKDGFIKDSAKIHISQSYVTYDSTIESERDHSNAAATEADDENGDGSPKSRIIMNDAPLFSPKNNLYGSTGFIETPDCQTLPEGNYRIGYDVMRSKKTTGAAYSESNYAISAGYGFSENVECSVFALQNFTGDKTVSSPRFFNDKTGISLKYKSSMDYRAAEQKIPYALLYTHQNSGTDEISIPLEFDCFNGKFYLIPSYYSSGGKVNCNFGYNLPLTLDHRKISYIMEFIQDDKSRWKTINGGFRFEFKNDTAVNFYVLTDQNMKRITTSIGATMLFK